MDTPTETQTSDLQAIQTVFARLLNPMAHYEDLLALVHKAATNVGIIPLEAPQVLDEMVREIETLRKRQTAWRSEMKTFIDLSPVGTQTDALEALWDRLTRS